MIEEESSFPFLAPVLRRAVPLVAAFAAAGGIGYAVHEHHAAQKLATQNQQVTAQLQATNQQLNALTAKVNAMATPPSAPVAAPADAPALAPADETKPSAAVPMGANGTRQSTGVRKTGAWHGRAEDKRFAKMQSQLDAQGKEIEDTRGDLVSTRTELSGSIARTHGELVLLEKKGERNYFEFDIQKSKQFQREGPVGIRLRKANTKHGYADLELMVEDRDVTQKHVNVFQPVMYYQSDSPQPMEVVINAVTKDHIHGYVSAPKYRQSDLTAMAAANTANPANPAQADAGVVGDDTADASAQPPVRRKLTVPPQ